MKLLNNTKFLVLVYFSNILLFALIYTIFDWLLTDQFNNKNINFFEFIYFSVVTATTLGYGDIHPIGSIAQIFVVLEVLIAIGTLGLALSAMWQKNQRENYPDRDIEEYMLFATHQYRREIIHKLYSVLSILDQNLMDLNTAEWMVPPQGRPSPRFPELSNYKIEDDKQRLIDFYQRMYYTRKFSTDEKENQFHLLLKMLSELEILLANREYVEPMSKLWPDANYIQTTQELFGRIVDFEEFLNGRYNFMYFSSKNSDKIANHKEIVFDDHTEIGLLEKGDDIVFPAAKCMVSLYNNLRQLNSDKNNYFQFSFIEKNKIKNKS